MLLSIVSPVYQAQNIVKTLVAKICDAVQTITEDFEIILVEDGSMDNSWLAIEEAAQQNKHVKGIKLSRNFGQHFAITAGISKAKGNFVVVMDCDLQEDPKYIPILYQKILEGYEIVFTEKEKKKHSLFKKMTSFLFNYLYNFLVNEKMQKRSVAIANLSIVSRKAVDAYLSFNDYRHQYISVLRWIGFKYETIEIAHEKRFEGKSSYSLYKMWSLGLDAIVSQSDKLLRMTIGLGFILFLISMLSVLAILILYMFIPFAHGWASLATLIIFTSGVIVFSIGICGIYIGKTFEQTKMRPRYIVDKTINL
jgi:glycosyltransferase involved in cell wall biosynthesis